MEVPTRAGERAWLPALLLILVVVLLWLPGLDDGGPEMDEGVLLAYPSLIAEHGLVPGRDFETFYGPGQPYLLAGAGELFGLSQGLQRVLALVFQLGIVMAIFALVLPVGRWIAAVAGVATTVLLIGLNMQGLAIFGGLAALLTGLAILAARDRRPAPPGHSPRRIEALAPALAGLAAALALTFRPDLAPAVLLSAAPLLLWRAPGVPLGPRGRRWLAAFLIGLVPLLAWLLVVGPDGISRLLDDLAASRPGRRLPLPAAASTEGRLLGALLAVIAGGLLAAGMYLRRDRYDADGRILASTTVLLIALLPTAVQRADAAHILPVAAIAVGLAPLVGRALLDLFPQGVARLAVFAWMLLVAVGLVQGSEVGLREQATSISAGGSEVVVGDRSFRASDPEAAADLRVVLARLADETEPGDSLFVGTSDLTRTVYSDTFVYYLFPELVPASFYTELNPGTANGEDSTLPAELEEADALLLTSRWGPDTEAAAEAGSAEAQAVADERFCTAAKAGTYELLLPCPADAAVGNG